MPASLVLAAALAVQAPPPPPPVVDAFVGRWNVRITDASDTFVSGGFQITSRTAPSPPASCGAGAATCRPSPSR